jgi:thiol-disulfide isomerase/thioredoxin
MQDEDNAVDGTPQPEAQEQQQQPSRKATWLAMGAVALAVGLIWMAPGLDPHDTETAGLEHPGEPEDAEAIGKPARLDFVLKDMNGADVDMQTFKGKIILLNFWATWCGPCKAEIPSLVELQTQYADDLVVLGLSIDDPADKLRPYAAEFKMNYPVLVGGREDVQEAFGPLFGVPVSVIIDREGKIAMKHSGMASKEQLERQIKTLL